jgi:hypothetical protein
MQRQVCKTAIGALLVGLYISHPVGAQSVRNVSPSGTTMGTVEPTPEAATGSAAEAADKLIEALEGDGNDRVTPEQRRKLAALIAKADALEQDRYVQEQADKLQSALSALNKDPTFKASEVLTAKLIALASQADMALRTAAPVAAFERLASMTGLTIDSMPQSDSAESFAALYKKLTDNWRGSKATAFVTFSGTVTKLLADDQTKQELVLDKPVRDAAKLLSDAVKPLAEAAEKRVHIVAALYGDRRTISKVLALNKNAIPGLQDRWCNATAAMRQQCEYRRNCTAPPVISTSLCGYDPVPFAEPQFKSAVVFYRCLDSNEPKNWTDEAGAPDQNNAVNLRATKGTLSVSLWNEKQGIYCAAQ